MHHYIVLNVAVIPNLDVIDIPCKNTTSLPTTVQPRKSASTPNIKHLPLRIAPYQTEDPLPSVTSPIKDEFGATKISSESCGLALANAWRV